MPVKRHSVALGVRAQSAGVGTGRVLASRLMLTAGWLGLLVSVMGADVENQFQVGVRSAVLGQPANASGKSDPQVVAERGRIYGILAVQLIKSESMLVKPVDAQRLMTLVCRALDTHGFRQVDKGHQPEILITVQYGRGWLPNPYLAGARFGATDATNSGFLLNSGSESDLAQGIARGHSGCRKRPLSDSRQRHGAGERDARGA